MSAGFLVQIKYFGIQRWNNDEAPKFIGITASGGTILTQGKFVKDQHHTDGLISNQPRVTDLKRGTLALKLLDRIEEPIPGLGSNSFWKGRDGSPR